MLKPIHKFNNGNGATLCHNCHIIINNGFSDALFCSDKCQEIATLKGELGLYKKFCAETVEALSFMHDDKSLGLTIGSKLHTDGIVALKKQSDELKSLVSQLLDMLETVETSDNETDFHPTVIRTCRLVDSMRLSEIMLKITKIVRGGE